MKSYRIDLKQTGGEGVSRVSDGKAHFSFTKDGKTKTSEEKIGDDFVVGPAIVGYLQKHWSEISRGDHIKVRLAVPDRLETVGFEYFKEKEQEIGGVKTFVIKMKPSSFLISALVDPLHFYFTADGSKVVQIEGRTQPKRQEGSKFHDLDALTIYDR